MKNKAETNAVVTAASMIVQAQNGIAKTFSGKQSLVAGGSKQQMVSLDEKALDPQTMTSDQRKNKGKRSRTTEQDGAKAACFQEPWGSLLRRLHEMLRDKRSDTPLPSGDGLSPTQLVLFKFICAHLQDVNDVVLNEKDLLLSLSGVVNLRDSTAQDKYGRRLISTMETSAPRPRPFSGVNESLVTMSMALCNEGITGLQDKISIMDAERVANEKKAPSDPTLKITLDVVRFL